MDNIWDRNPSKLQSLAVVAGMKKRMTTQNRQKSNAKNSTKNTYKFILLHYTLSNILHSGLLIV